MHKTVPVDYFPLRLSQVLLDATGLLTDSWKLAVASHILVMDYLQKRHGDLVSVRVTVAQARSLPLIAPWLEVLSEGETFLPFAAAKLMHLCHSSPEMGGLTLGDPT